MEGNLRGNCHGLVNMCSVESLSSDLVLLQLKQQGNGTRYGYFVAI